MLSVQDWHRRFRQQAEWTKGIRNYLFDKIHFDETKAILDVGCGTGAILTELPKNGTVHGLDIDHDRLIYAQINHKNVPFICADAHQLPYPDNSFSIVLCHFLLLWVTSPELVIKEMIRVGKPGGFILMLAEPDYGGRIDFPESLQELGEIQAQSLQSQGADPNTGRKLAKWLYEAGLNVIELGVLGGQWQGKASSKTWNSEWKMLESDLENILPEDELKVYKEIDKAAWEDGSRVLFVPTFYAVGIIP
jgi:ubiquinone/menaquinone biosynthesis C-methylase UbiE